MLRRLSLRVRTVLLATVVTTVVLGAGGVALVLGLQRSLSEGVNDITEVRAADLAALAARGRLTDPIRTDPDEAVVQVVDITGRVVAASEGITGLPAGARRPALGQQTAQHVDAVPGAQGDSGYRLVAQTVMAPTGQVTVYVAGSLEDVAETRRATIHLLLFSVPALASALSAGTWVLVGRTLAPVARMTARAAGIHGGELHARLPEPPSRDEVGELARTLNGMLARIEDGVSRQRRFVADAAHELRTPLTVLQAQLESGGSTQEVLAEVLRLQALADGLLLLARLGRATEVRRRPVDLDAAVDAALHRLPEHQGVRIDASGVQPAQVDGAEDLLERVAGNLLGNAVRHARSRVRVRTGHDEQGVVLEVEDDGSGIAAEDRMRVLEPFTRLDESRSRNLGGTGLGLAIVRDVVIVLGGTVVIGSANGGGARITVHLPRSTA